MNKGLLVASAEGRQPMPYSHIIFTNGIRLETDFEHWLHRLHAFVHEFLHEWEQSTIVHTLVKLKNRLSQGVSKTIPEKKPATSNPTVPGAG